MCRANFCGSILTVTLLAGAGVPTIARADDLPRVSQRLKLVPSLRLEVPVSESGPVRRFEVAAVC